MDDDARWIADVLGHLQAPQAVLVRELLTHLAELQEEEDDDLLAAGNITLTSVGGRPPAQGDRVRHQHRRQRAIFDHLHDRWMKTRSLPACAWKQSVYRDTAVFAHTLLSSSSYLSALIHDPLCDEPDRPLTRERAREYAITALDLARQIGDHGKVGEAAITVARYHLLSSDFEDALACCRIAAAEAGATGSLAVLASAHGLTNEIYTLVRPELATRIGNLDRYCEVLRREGDFARLLNITAERSRLQVLDGDLHAAEEGLALASEAYDILASPAPEPTLVGQIDHHLFGARSLLHHARGAIDDAIAAAAEACARNAAAPACREDYLAYDLSWLESLCNAADRQGQFLSWCDAWARDELDLQTWYLVHDTPDPPDWEEDWQGSEGVPAGWTWVDPLGRSVCETTCACLRVRPVMGGGFLSNVTAPRILRPLRGDFVLETAIDFASERRCAGGLLFYGDDHTLLRFGVGLHFDGETSLTVKSADTGFAIVARGLLESPRIRLRLSRRGEWFRAWCSDGAGWWLAGQAEVRFPEQGHAGLFAECSYRMFAADRCQDNPVCFTSVRLATV